LPPSADTRSLFARPDYRRLWAIGGMTGVARWLEFVAIAIFAYELTRSPELVATRALGPLIGGVTYQAVGISGIYCVIAMSYLVCLALAARVGVHSEAATAAASARCSAIGTPACCSRGWAQLRRWK